MKDFHRLLKRQLAKADLDEQTLIRITPLLCQIDLAYKEFDKDILHTEHILELSSQELFEANQQLKNSVETISGQLSKIAGNIKDVIFEMDLEGNWSYLNPAWENLTGLKVQDCLGQPYTNYLKDEAGNPYNLLKEFNSAGPNAFAKTIQLKTSDGQLKWLEFSLKSIPSKKAMAEGFIGTIVDITTLKETELALTEAKEKESRANKAKDEFLSTMSHEIRTPLSAVIGISHLLLLENPRPDQMENMETLKHSSAHLLCLVNDILDFNKITSGVLELEEANFNIHYLLDGIHSIFNNIAKSKGIRLNIKKDRALAPNFIGDSTRITQIISNLINNAIKFTEQGKVLLDIEVVQDTEEFQVLECKIVDTGIGIPDLKQKKIFQSFTQANSDTTRKYGGTGLGLAICKQLLERMDSSIHLKSKVGKGSTFSFSLTLPKANSNEEIENINNKYQLGFDQYHSLDGIKILAVDDNKINIMVLEKFLTKWRVDYDIAENGLIALEKAKVNSYDLILMDLHMPVLNGFIASKLIRETDHTPNKTTPIYAFSASIGMDVKKETEKYGIDGLILKPFDPFKLYTTLSQIVAQHKHL
ncbi:response regulator [Arenibacter sp. 6A1]|uniref:ATP-binding protein n=1 Tax=Arenibacter sp. 6A1 TaxID=2720391 RepID=UPI001447AFC6|nr:ATP-binding protein [Arenibacter sp. 6A1]NKI25176.1 response regulator [Arenibacter sp. 6A1]